MKPVPPGYTAELGRATWALERISKDRRVIWIRDAESGCNRFDHAEVSEAKGGLRVVVFDRVLIPDRRHGCLLYLRAARYRIELPRRVRVGEKIFGRCVPGEATPAGRICALVHKAAEGLG